MSKIHRPLLTALTVVFLAARLAPPPAAALQRDGAAELKATADSTGTTTKTTVSSPPATPESAGEPAQGEGQPEAPVKFLGGLPISAEGARLTEEGLQQMRMRHFNEAIDAFKKVTKVDGEHPVVWNNLGSAYLATGNALKAKGAFTEAVDLDPNYAMAHYNLGATLDLELNYDGAIESYARALELAPELGSAENNPAIVNNTHLAAVHLVLYKRQLGALGTGITPITDTAEEDGAKKP